MGYIFAMVVGYLIGARARSEDLDRLSDTVRAVRESGELADLMAAARSHVGHTLRELADVVEGSGDRAGGGFGASLLGGRAKIVRGAPRERDPLGHPGEGDADGDGDGGGVGDDLVARVQHIFGQRS
jgi:hypothetical protein